MTRVVRAGSVSPRRPSLFADGDLSVSTLLSVADGSVHLEVAIADLAEGGRVRGHLHAFEESFFVLSGNVVLYLAGGCWSLGPSDFGVIPLGHPHAWHNPGPVQARWLVVRAPQPRSIGSRRGTWPVDCPVPNGGRPVTPLGGRSLYVGHFDEADLPPPGPLPVPGYHGPHARSISIALMVDELLGARHQNLFVVQLDAHPGRPGAAKTHYHPFEEMFYFLQGRAEAVVGDETFSVGAGDLVFAGVNTSHAFRALGSEPARWIEAQAPLPPASHAFFFEDDWKDLDALSVVPQKEESR